VAFVERHYVARNATLIVTGSFDPALYEDGVRRLFGRWRAGATTPPAPTAGVARAAPAHLAVELGGDLDGQIGLSVAYAVPRPVDGQYAARLVLARMLELRARRVRERLGASYGLDAGLVVNVGPGAYGVAGWVDAARGGEALALLRAAIDELRRGEGFDLDFVRARRLVLAELLAASNGPSATLGRLTFLAIHGLDDDFFDQILRRVAALSPEQVRELVQRELDPAHEVLVVTGAREPVMRAYADAGLAPPEIMAPWPGPAPKQAEPAPAPPPAPPASP
jgi:predicted Zn-dependent peptidase